MADPAFTSTPKRKRGTDDEEGVLFTPTSIPKFSLQHPTPAQSIRSEGSRSPSSRIAQKIGSLVLGGGAPVDGARVSPSGCDYRNDKGTSNRKRQKLPGSLSLLPNAKLEEAPLSSVNKNGSETKSSVLQIQQISSSSRDQPSGSTAVDPLSYPNSRRKRAGTPPLTSRKASGIKDPHMDADDDASPGAPRVVDPLRASLTWHEDEITIYDPDDSDDDGTGINGVGFKPTPAIEQARAFKRMQQLAKYRQMEEVEARDKRRQRRHLGNTTRDISSDSQVERRARKVRFMETEPKTAILTG